MAAATWPRGRRWQRRRRFSWQMVWRRMLCQSRVKCTCRCGRRGGRLIFKRYHDIQYNDMKFLVLSTLSYSLAHGVEEDAVPISWMGVQVTNYKFVTQHVQCRMHASFFSFLLSFLWAYQFRSPRALWPFPPPTRAPTPMMACLPPVCVCE